VPVIHAASHVDHGKRVSMVFYLYASMLFCYSYDAPLGGSSGCHSSLKKVMPIPNHPPSLYHPLKNQMVHL